MGQVHNVFHVSLIKPYLSDGRTQPPPAPELIDNTPEWIVEQVIDHRIVYRGRQKKIEYLIHWEGYGDEHNTWEPSANTTNAADAVQYYWQSLPPGERLAAASVMHVAHTDIIAVLHQGRTASPPSLGLQQYYVHFQQQKATRKQIELVRFHHTVYCEHSVSTKIAGK